MSKLYIIQGFIGAGKSTYSKQLEEQTGAVRLCPDEMISSKFSKQEYMANWNKCFDETVLEMWELARQYLCSNKNVILDMGFWKKQDRDFARYVASECGASAKLIYIYAPDEILKERIVASRPPEWAKIHLENFEKNKSHFEEPTDEENATIIQNY